MGNQKMYGHTFLGPYQLADYVIPKDLLEGNIYWISTVWNEHLKKGQTCLFRVPRKNFYESEEHPPKIIREDYASKDEAFKAHKEIVQKIREGDIKWSL